MAVGQLETVRAAKNRGACQDAKRFLGGNLHKSSHGQLSVRG